MVTISTPLGRLGTISFLILSLTLSMTLRTFSPNLTTTMPAATSPWPSSSASPRRISGPSLMSATSFSRTGVPRPSVPTAMLGQILQAFNIAASPDHVFDPGKLENPAFHVAVALSYGLHHRHEGDVVGQKPVGIDGDLVLFDESAEARHLRYAGHALDGQLHVIVLNGAELRQVVLSRLIDHRVGKAPADGRGIGTQNGIDIGGDLGLHRLQVFQYPASRPVDVRPFIENDVDERTSQEGKSPDELDFRRRQQVWT